MYCALSPCISQGDTTKAKIFTSESFVLMVAEAAASNRNCKQYFSDQRLKHFYLSYSPNRKAMIWIHKKEKSKQLKDIN
jgi:hypothetical protein